MNLKNVETTPVLRGYRLNMSVRKGLINTFFKRLCLIRIHPAVQSHPHYSIDGEFSKVELKKKIFKTTPNMLIAILKK